MYKYNKSPFGESMKVNPSNKGGYLSEFENNIQKIIEISKSNNSPDIEKLQTDFLKSFPGQAEEVTSTFGLIGFIKDRLSLDPAHREKKDLSKEETSQIFENMTSYQYLINHMVHKNYDNPEFLKSFWRTCQKVCEGIDSKSTFTGLKRSILSQIAIFKSLEKLGLHPSLATPKEDAFSAIDFKIEGSGQVFQTKGTNRTEEAFLVKTDEIDFPGAEIDHPTEQSKIFLRDKMAHEFSKFKTKVSKYEKSINKKVEAYFLIVPDSKFNQNTGEPDVSLLEFFKQKFEQMQSIKIAA